MTLISNNELYGMNIGVVVFFFGKPSEKRKAICDVINSYFEIVSNKMTIFGYQNGIIKSIRGKKCLILFLRR